MNRLYYACFYAVTALLKTQGLESSKHTGVRSLFNRRFVKNGHVEVPLATIYNVLLERRQECDYEEYADATEEEMLDWMPRAEAFVSALAILTQEELDKEPTP